MMCTIVRICACVAMRRLISEIHSLAIPTHGTNVVVKAALSAGWQNRRNIKAMSKHNLIIYFLIKSAHSAGVECVAIREA